MKVKIQQQALNSALNIVKPFSSDKATQPVFSNILLQGDNNLLTVAASNAETIAVIGLPCGVDEAGGVTVPAGLLSNYVSTLSNDYIELVGTEFDLTVKQGRGKSKLNGIQKEEFVKLPEFGEGEIKLDLANFQNILKQVLFAVALDQSRPIFTGVNFRIYNNVLSLTAADGFKAANYLLECQAHDVNVTIPAEILQQIVRLKPIDNFSLTINDRNITFYGDNFILSSSVIEGQYPDVGRLEPKSFNSLITINRGDLVKALKRAAVFAADDANYVALIANGDNLNIETNQTQIGKFDDVVNCKLEGEGGLAWYNVLYLISMLSALSSDDIVIRFIDGKNPLVVKDGALTTIIMPMFKGEKKDA